MNFNTTDSVPVYNCVVYVSSESTGVHRARVANLAELEATAASEREALMKVTTAFKQRVAELRQEQKPIPWIEPPAPPQEGEQTRLVPVHL